jgi:hypothetical protein
VMNPALTIAANAFRAAESVIATARVLRAAPTDDRPKSRI